MRCLRKNANESIRVGKCKKNLPNTATEDIDRCWKCKYYL